MLIYPEEIASKVTSPRNAGRCEPESSSGKAVNFDCGCFVQVSILVSHGDKRIEGLRYATNGCGFMITAAETIVDVMSQKTLPDLHGFDTAEFLTLVETRSVRFPDSRKSCLTAVLEATRGALIAFRERLIGEFSGEKAMICTCFGVSEDSIEEFIRSKAPKSVDEITCETRAGGGCGSCRLLIQEMVDTHLPLGHENHIG